MGVSHGYGKAGGTDALTFAYDTGDTRNSYRGEPTTNLISSDGIDMSTLGSYTLLARSQVVDSSSPSGYACEMEVQDGATINDAARIQFGNATSIPTSGNVFVSVYVKFEGGPTSNIVPRVFTGYTWYDMAPLDGGSIYLTSEYRRFGVYVQVGTASGGPNPGFSMTHNNSNIQTGQKSRWHSPQVELKSHATQFVNGTRSDTQALLDLTGNSEITLNSVSFDSNAQMYFDGTDDSIGYAYVGISDYSQPFTMECVFIVDPAATWDNGYRSNIFGIAGSYAGMYGLNKHGGDSVGLYVRDASGGAAADVGGLSKGVYYHLVGTWDGTDDIRIYLNGSLRNTTTSAKSGAPDTTSIWLGGTRAYSGAGGQAYHGEIPVAKYYNRVLTAIEVRNNFNLYKGRFNM